MVEVDALSVPAVLGPPLATDVVDQNPPHCFGGGGKEMPAAIPVLTLFTAHEPQIDLVHQRRRLERLARRLLRHLLGGQSPQRIVDQRQQLLRRVRIALLDGGQDLRDFVHGICPNRLRHREFHPKLAAVLLPDHSHGSLFSPLRPSAANSRKKLTVGPTVRTGKEIRENSGPLSRVGPETRIKSWTERPPSHLQPSDSEAAQETPLISSSYPLFCLPAALAINIDSADRLRCQCDCTWNPPKPPIRKVSYAHDKIAPRIQDTAPYCWESAWSSGIGSRFGAGCSHRRSGVRLGSVDWRARQSETDRSVLPAA